MIYHYLNNFHKNSCEQNAHILIKFQRLLTLYRVLLVVWLHLQFFSLSFASLTRPGERNLVCFRLECVLKSGSTFDDNRQLIVTERGSLSGFVKLHHWKCLFTYKGRSVSPCLWNVFLFERGGKKSSSDADLKCSVSGESSCLWWFILSTDSHYTSWCIT